MRGAQQIQRWPCGGVDEVIGGRQRSAPGPCLPRDTWRRSTTPTPPGMGVGWGFLAIVLLRCMFGRYLSVPFGRIGSAGHANRGGPTVSLGGELS